jgi:hypothetical protein
MGGAWALDGLWRSIGIDAELRRLLVGRRMDERAERVLFAMVANRALEPLSKLAASKWVSERAWIAGLEELDEDACYRATDWLLEIESELVERVYFAAADLLNLEVDLLFFETTSTYSERDEPETDTVGEDGEILRPAFRVHGHSSAPSSQPATARSCAPSACPNHPASCTSPRPARPPRPPKRPAPGAPSAPIP